MLNYATIKGSDFNLFKDMENIHNKNVKLKSLLLYGCSKPNFIKHTYREGKGLKSAKTFIFSGQRDFMDGFNSFVLWGTIYDIKYTIFKCVIH